MSITLFPTTFLVDSETSGRGPDHRKLLVLMPLEGVAAALAFTE
jgi:hypothetical protein